mmetsp:Transcript_46401/g.140540  ORF Transcript_46401/g.140540 Transcript_46401/m.140540 type:complete len:173 (-) Transcript_46401:195-713(-)
MVRLSSIVSLIAVSHAAAFAPSVSFGVRSNAPVFMSDEAEAAEAVSLKTRTLPKSGAMASVKKSINGLTADNFSETLASIEPFFMNEAGTTFYAKSMKRISSKAKMLGAEIPADFAKEAATTAKRRARQDAFIAVKEEEAAAAAAEAAEAAAAEAAAAVEAETAEEPTPVEA